MGHSTSAHMCEVIRVDELRRGDVDIRSQVDKVKLQQAAKLMWCIAPS